MFRIIIDANVWIRYSRIQNISPLLDRFITYNLIPVVNNYLLSEIFSAVIENKWMNENGALKMLDFIRKVSIVSTERAVFRLSYDPKDNYLFDLAVQNNCAFIITDDNLLLQTPVKPIATYTSAWFLKHFPLQ